MGKSNLICPKIQFPYRWIKYGVKIYKRLYEKTLRIKLGAVHVTVRRDSVTKLLYLFRNRSAIRKIRLLLSILSNIYSNPISSFLSISAKPKSANESGATGGKFCFIYLSSVSYLAVFFIFWILSVKKQIDSYLSICFNFIIF